MMLSDLAHIVNIIMIITLNGVLYFGTRCLQTAEYFADRALQQFAAAFRCRSALPQVVADRLAAIRNACYDNV